MRNVLKFTTTHNTVGASVLFAKDNCRAGTFELVYLDWLHKETCNAPEITANMLQNMNLCIKMLMSPISYCHINYLHNIQQRN